jgi:O-antigen ligase
MTEPAPKAQPKFAGWMGSMWMYTILRFALFFALWGIVVLLGLHGLFAALVALVLSVPLSFVLLARPRAIFVRQLEQRVDARKAARADLDAELDAGSDPDPDKR